jgi:PBP1b-binding outer membrane lipoprotein LpoB
MSLKKIVSSLFLLCAMLIFSGCGETKKDAEDKNTPMPQTSTEVKNENAESLPEPTGDIDDIVNSAISGSETEKNYVSAEESETEADLDNSQEMDDFGQSYDENEF